MEPIIEEKSENSHETTPILGYWDIRGQAQSIRY
jgi:hypothetical protein